MQSLVNYRYTVCTLYRASQKVHGEFTYSNFGVFGITMSISTFFSFCIFIRIFQISVFADFSTVSNFVFFNLEFYKF